jgi:uncharacterized repeat protein (TIGR01451 family)
MWRRGIVAVTLVVLTSCTDFVEPVASPDTTEEAAPAPLRVDRGQPLDGQFGLASEFCSSGGGVAVVAGARGGSLQTASLVTGPFPGLDAGGGQPSDIMGLNDLGYAVGRQGDRPALRLPNGTWMQLSTLVGAAYDINNAGEIVGYVVSSSVRTAMLWTVGGSSTELRLNAEARAINESGTVVGFTTVAPLQGFRKHRGGALELIDRKGGTRPTRFYAINGSGAIAGSAGEGTATVEAIRYEGAMYHPVSIPAGGTSGIAYGINDSGAIVGSYVGRIIQHPSPVPPEIILHAFYTYGSVAQRVPQLDGGANTNVATAINSRGWVVGWTYDPDTGGMIGFVWDSSTPGAQPISLTKLLEGGGCSSFTLAINECGTVGGRTTYPAGTPQNGTLWRLCQPDLVIEKRAVSDVVESGGQIGFMIDVRNNGPGYAHDVLMTDLLPAVSGDEPLNWRVDPMTPGCTIENGTLTCAFGVLAPDASRRVTVVAPTVQDRHCTQVRNTASVTAIDPLGPGRTSPPRTATAEVALSCNFTASVPALEVRKVATSATVLAPATMGFTIEVENVGARDATVELTDQLPTGNGLAWSVTASPSSCTISSVGVLSCTFPLAIGASATVSVETATSYAACGEYRNIASAVGVSAVGTRGDPHPSNEAKATVTCPAPLWTVTKEASAAEVAAGTPVGFTIHVANTGVVPTNAITVTDPLPGTPGLNWSITAAPTTGCSIANGILSCALAPLAVGGSYTIQISAPTTTANCGMLSNTVTVTSGAVTQPANAVTEVTCPPEGAVLLIIDEDGIDNGLHLNRTGGGITPSGPSFWTEREVNDDIAAYGLRAVLRYFADARNFGRTITVRTGQTGDEGWFAPNCIPRRWLSSAVSVSDDRCMERPDRDAGLRNFFFSGQKPLGTATPNSWALPQSRLDKIPHVMPLRARGLVSLTGRNVCAVVYDSDISINYDHDKPIGVNGNLQGATLGIAAFRVNQVRTLNNFSSSTLPEVQITVLDAAATCTNFQLFNAPVPNSSSVPNDRRVESLAGTGSNGYRSIFWNPAYPVFF